MSYYPTLAEDVQRAKEILARGKAEFDDKLGDILPGLADEHLAQIKDLVGGTIYGADIYAAYKLLESFVEAIACVGVDVVTAAVQARQRGLSYTCPRCGAVSHNMNDVRQRYCGRCHRFQDETTP